MSRIDQNQKYTELIRHCDLLIKAGNVNQVAHLISQLNMVKVPREARAGLAKACRRAGLIHSGLRLLYPIIRDEADTTANASTLEICEYSALLARNGSIQEALSLLHQVRASEASEVSLYTGQCHVINWEYSKAAGLFQKYLSSDAEEYSKLIARVNLAACYVVTSQFEEAVSLVQESIVLAQKLGATRLMGNCYELWAQVCFWRNDFQNARQCLEKTSEILGTSQSLDNLLVHKTAAIMSALERQSIEPLLKFRVEALAHKHWDSLREADLFALKVQFEQRRLDHLIFGTPMRPYRQRIQDVLQATPNQCYVWGTREDLVLDLQTGKMNKGVSLEPGRKIHQVLACLSQDFYAPTNVGKLFSELYPEEFFNVDSSPFRIRQLMMRTRTWLKENSIPARIEQEDGSYRLLIDEVFGVQVSLEADALDPQTSKWQELRSGFREKNEFTAEEACHHLKCSRASFLRLAEWALLSGHLLKTGAGKATRYTIESKLPLAA